MNCLSQQRLYLETGTKDPHQQCRILKEMYGLRLYPSPINNKVYLDKTLWDSVRWPEGERQKTDGFPRTYTLDEADITLLRAINT